MNELARGSCRFWNPLRFLSVGRSVLLLTAAVILAASNLLLAPEATGDQEGPGLWGAGFPAARARIELEPPFHIGGDPANGPSPDLQSSPAVGFDGSNFLVVWMQDREDFSLDIHGARVTPGGTVVDTLGIAIGTGREDEWFPAVAFGGRTYLVVWKARRSGSQIYDLYGARVTPSGDLLDSERIRIREAVRGASPASVAFDGRNYLVVWVGTGEKDDEIRGARVSTSGVVLDEVPISISCEGENLGPPALAFNGTNYLVAWTDSRNSPGGGTENDIYCSRVTPSGAVLDPGGIPVSTAEGMQQEPAVASDGNDYIVVWEDSRSEYWDVHCARVSASGEVLGPDTTAVVRTTGAQILPEVAFNGVDYVVTWVRATQPVGVYAARVSTSGEVLDRERLTVRQHKHVMHLHVSVARGDDNVLAVWTEKPTTVPPSPSTIHGARITTEGTVLDPAAVVLSTGSSAQLSPAITSDETHYTVAWVDSRSGRWGIYARRIDLQGAVLDPDAIAISISDGIDNYHPGMASNGTDCMIVWTDSPHGPSQIFGARLSPSGEVLDPNGIHISVSENRPRRPALASDGKDYLAVWTDYITGGSVLSIFGTRVSRSGDVLDPGTIPISPMSYGGDPAVAFGESSYLVVWDAYQQSPEGFIRSVRGARVSRSGELLDPQGIAVSDPGEGNYEPAIAFDGTNYLVVWLKRSTYIVEVRGARVSASGAVLDATSFPISQERGVKRTPSVTFEGDFYLVSWSEVGEAGGVKGARVRPSGELVDLRALPLADDTGVRTACAISSADSGQTLLAYSAYTNVAPYNSYRMWARFWRADLIEPEIPLFLSPTVFVGTLNVRYNMPGGARVRLAVFDATGRLVKTIAHGYRAPGWHHETWDGTNEEGRAAPSGVYFTRIQCKFGRASGKCVLAR